MVLPSSTASEVPRWVGNPMVARDLALIVHSPKGGWYSAEIAAQWRALQPTTAVLVLGRNDLWPAWEKLSPRLRARVRVIACRVSFSNGCLSDEEARTLSHDARLDLQDKHLARLTALTTTTTGAGAADKTSGGVATPAATRRPPVVVINSPLTMALASRTMALSAHLHKAQVPGFPRTWEGVSQDDATAERILRELLPVCRHKACVVKPLTSKAQGAHAHKISAAEVRTVADVRAITDKVPGNRFVIQDFVDYACIYRIVCIAGKALPFAFKDVPGGSNSSSSDGKETAAGAAAAAAEAKEGNDHDESSASSSWRVSVCLNPRMTYVSPTPPAVAALALRVQHAVQPDGGGVHFIDIFEEKKTQTRGEDGAPSLWVSEINQTCVLALHSRIAKAAGEKRWNIAKWIAEEYARNVPDAAAES